MKLQPQITPTSFAPYRELEIEPFSRSLFLHWMWQFFIQRMTQAGRWFLWPTIVFTWYGASSLELQGYVPFCYAAGLWIMAFLGMILFRPRLRLKAEHAARICAGEILPVELFIEGLSLWSAPHLSVIPHQLPVSMESVPEEGTALPALTRGQKLRTQLGLRCIKRGHYQLQGFRVETEFPLGLLRASRAFRQEQGVLVYPRFTRLSRLNIPTGRRYQPGGVALASSLGDSYEYIGNREYREGDNIRDIDWRATARLNMPIVREYREEYFLRVAVLLDTYVPNANVRKKDLPPGANPDVRVAAAAAAAQREALERSISFCAAVSDYMSLQEYIIDLFAAGPNLYHLTAGRNIAYFDQILDILACVAENPEEPFELIEPEILENLASITTVICIFLDWNETRRAFVQRLRQQGAGPKIVIFRDTPCTLDPSLEADILGHIPVISQLDFDAGIREL